MSWMLILLLLVATITLYRIFFIKGNIDDWWISVIDAKMFCVGQIIQSFPSGKQLIVEDIDYKLNRVKIKICQNW